MDGLNLWELYEPHEDSFQLQKIVSRYAKGRVLDMGTGSGIQAQTASNKKTVESVLAVDINPAAIGFVKKQKLAKVTTLRSDLFTKVKGTFDTIIFNPPYLPQEGKSPIIALEGGKHGYEVIERFLNDVGGFITPGGQVLLLYSSHSKPEYLEKVLTRNMLHQRVLSETNHFFEKLYVVRIRKDPLRQRLEKLEVSKIQYLAQGHRGIVFTARYEKKKVGIKVKNATSEAKSRIANEAKYLRLLNKHNIGPRILKSTTRYLMYEFVEGVAIRDGYEKLSSSALKRVLIRVLEQAYTLDQLGINKLEMHRPHKHILLTKKGPVMIDFERCYDTRDPKNVTQFCQYLRNMKDRFSTIINIDKSRMSALAKSYSKDRSKQKIEEIKKEIKRA